MTDKYLTRFEITPFTESKQFRFHFQLDGKLPQVEFFASFENAMYFLKHLQDFQVQYELPIPRRTPKGNPKLFLVKDDDGV